MSTMLATGRNVGNKMTGGDIIPKGFQKGQLSQFTPDQMQLFQQMFSQLGPNSFLSKLAGGDESQFEQLEAPAKRQFQGLQGQIASRFAGMGHGALRSSGFKNTMNQASSDFAQALQSQRMGLQQQAMKDLFGMSESLLNQRPYDQFLTEKPKSFLQQLLMGISPAFAQGAGQAAGIYGLNKWGNAGSPKPAQGGDMGSKIGQVASMASMFL